MLELVLSLSLLLGERQYYCYEKPGFLDTPVCYTSPVKIKYKRNDVFTVKTDSLYVELIQLTKPVIINGKNTYQYFAAVVGDPGSLYFIYKRDDLWAMAPTHFNKMTDENPAMIYFAFSTEQLKECQ